MHGSAMRASGSSQIEAELHLMDRPLEIGSRHEANGPAALVASDDGLASAGDPVQAPAIRRPEVGMRESGPYDPFLIHVFTVNRRASAKQRPQSKSR